MNREVKLSVNDLKISFRTDAGKVQAVRNISFDLYKGETLAIVGESGSGKSVTSKAIMGISAGNSIYEGGEILYDGQDLTRIPEEEMHKLRGDKIAMIFQDPLSSLNPIMRIGRQITEAMLLKNKANRKEGRVTFNKTLAVLSDTIKKALAEKPQPGVTAADVDKYIKTFDAFNIQAIKLENSYNDARTAAEEMIAVIEDLLFMTENKQKVDVVGSLGLIKSRLKEINDKYFVAGYADALKTIFTNSYNMTDKMFMGASTKQGLDIANKSREIIRGLIGDDVKDLNPAERDIVERIVHSTADPEYAKLVKISPDFVDVAMDSLRNKETILTDINMVKYGITRYEGEVECYIRNEEVIKIAKENQITRAAAAMRYAAQNDFEGIVVSGNAPTAVFEAMDLYQKGEMNLKAIVGVPVGFVGAADSKEALHNSDIPNIIVEGPKGGTPIAVACVNSLIQHL